MKTVFRTFFTSLLSLFGVEVHSTIPTLLSVDRIWDIPDHAAFTDLIYAYNTFFVCFRESDSHEASQDGSIRILSSSDGIQWTSTALIYLPGRDLRDPMLSLMPNGSLMLTMGGSVYSDGKFRSRNPCVAFSSDGSNWSPVDILDMPGEWIWRVTWHQGIGYGASYSFSDPEDINKPWLLKLYKTTDGLHYTYVAPLEISQSPSEATLRFTHDGTLIALVRRQGTGWMGSASAPYEKWAWTDIAHRLGGPNFLIVNHNEEMWASSRQIKKNLIGQVKASVVITKMGLTEYQPVLTLPSGGDCGYPGMVYRNGNLYISYYSSHEGKASIYFAIIRLP